MTVQLMQQFGVTASFEGNKVRVKPQRYKGTSHTVEYDWFAASYWFAFTALDHEAEILLPRISLTSLQGDRTVVDIMLRLGVNAVMDDDKVKLTTQEHESRGSCDFRHCPHLAHAIAEA